MAFVDPFSKNKTKNNAPASVNSGGGFTNPFIKTTNTSKQPTKSPFDNFNATLDAQNNKQTQPIVVSTTPTTVKVEDKNWLKSLFSNVKKSTEFASPAIDYAKANVKATAGVVLNKLDQAGNTPKAYEQLKKEDQEFRKRTAERAKKAGMTMEEYVKKNDLAKMLPSYGAFVQGERLRGASKELKESAGKSMAVAEEKVKKIGSREGFWGLADQVVLSSPSMVASLGIGTATTLVTKNPVLGISLGFSNAFSQEAGSAYLDAKKFGADEETAENVGIGVGTVNGVLETLPVGKVLNRIAKTAGGDITTDFLKKNILKNVAQQIALEGGTESIQQVVSNAVATTYDENRELLAGVPESFFVGAIMGGFTSLGTDTTIAILQKTTNTGKGIDEINDKIETAIETPATKRSEEQKQIVETLFQKELTPDQAISTVINSGIENTPIGKEIMKSVVEAKQSGNNIKISSIDGENVEVKSVDPQESIKSIEEYVNQKPEKFREIKTEDPLTQEATKHKSAEEFVKAKGIDPDSVLIKDSKNFVVENSAGNDALLTELPVSFFGKPKFTTLNQFRYEAGRKIIDPIEATIKDGKLTITDGANRFTQAKANGDKTIPVIIDNFDGSLPTQSQLTDIWNKANKPTKEKKSSKPRPEELDPETRSLLTGSQAQEANATKPIDKRTQAELKDRLEELEIRRSKVESDRAILSNFDSDMLKGVRRIQRKLAIIEKRGGDPTEVTNDKAYKTYIEDLMAFLNTNSEDKAIDYLLNDFPEPIRRVSTKEDLEEIRYLKSKLSPKEVEVPRGQIPVGTGKERVNTLEARIKKVLKKASQETIDQLGLSTYNQMIKKEQIQKAVEYVSKNPQDALKVLKGDLDAPQGLLKNSIYVAMERLAVGDVNLARKLASIEATRLGQELSILTEIDPNSPVKIMREIIKIREEAFRNKFKNKTKKEVSAKLVRDIKAKVKKPSKSDWNTFIEQIKC